MAEGSVWEAFEHAAHWHLDNLTVIVDVNRLGQSGETMHGRHLMSYAERACSFGWAAFPIDGHDLEAIDDAYAEAIRVTDRPSVIVAETRKGRGVAAVEDEPGWHGKVLPDPRRDRRPRRPAHPADPRRRTPAGADPTRLRAPTYGASELRGRDRQGDPTRLRGSACRTQRRPRRRRCDGRRGLQLDLLRSVCRGASGALLRDVRRRTADDRRRRRLRRPRPDPVRVGLGCLLQPRVRLHPHGGDQPRLAPDRRLARRRRHRRGRPLADGTRGQRDVPRRPRQHRPLPQRRQPDRQAGRARRRQPRRHVPAHHPAGYPSHLLARGGVQDRRQPPRARLIA
jgi:transketolase-like protein